MDNLENQTPSQPDSPDLQVQVNALYDLVNRLLVLGVVASGAFSIYVISQWWFVRAECSGSVLKWPMSLPNPKKPARPSMSLSADWLISAGPIPILCPS